jgi:hypothetical protein
MALAVRLGEAKRADVRGGERCVMSTIMSREH